MADLRAEGPLHGARWASGAAAAAAPVAEPLLAPPRPAAAAPAPAAQAAEEEEHEDQFLCITLREARNLVAKDYETSSSNP